MTVPSARALVILAPGAEEMEAVIVVDVLRRAGVEVVLAGLAGAEPVTCSRGVVIVPDLRLADVRGSFDAVVLPGGAPGARALAESAEVGHLLTQQVAAGRVVAALCAAPTALARHGVMTGARVTAHPSVWKELSAYRLEETAVVVDGKLVTSQGPGTSFAFALALVELLCGADRAGEIAEPMRVSARGELAVC